MSHLPERQEKNCLNCNAQIQGRFCHICGQENVVTKESVWDLVTHFFQDITHFHGKFFSTLRHLIFRPGFLSREYNRGRRASYVNPVRLYVFTSFVFFLIYFNFYNKPDSDDGLVRINVTGTTAQIQENLQEEKIKNQKLLAQSKSVRDSIRASLKLEEIEEQEEMLRKDTSQATKNKITGGDFGVFNFSRVSDSCQSLKEYDSLQNVLPENKKDGFLVRKMARRNFYLKEKYQGNSRQIMQAIFNDFLHRFPQLLFVSLPIYAFLLWLLYIRHKQLYYVNHAIFSIHQYCAYFVLLLLAFWLNGLANWAGKPGVADWVTIIFGWGMVFYFYKSMRQFYQQGRAKTILKVFLLLMMSIVAMIILFAAFLIFSTFSV